MTSPIHRVLFTLSSQQVRCLLIGGQACIFYGAAEFSRDADIALLASDENLHRLRNALRELNAAPIAVPPLAPEYLLRGHAVHFRCAHPDAAGVRIDLIARMRGVDPFEDLWGRRTTVEVGPGESYDVISLPDLVRSKKTQRDKDWPMIRRLVEANYVSNREAPTPKQVEFWLREGRTPQLLKDVARHYPEAAGMIRRLRPLIAFVQTGDDAALERELESEEKREREADREYWKPLREELERLRHAL
ncbi:MAG: hypothetical protein AB1428_14570 [Bacteroidota bacterium]